MQKNPIPCAKALPAKTLLRVIQKKREYTVFPFGKKNCIIKRNRNKFLVHDVWGVTQTLLRHHQKMTFPSGEESDSWVQLSLGAAPGWEVRESLCHTRDVPRPDLFLCMSRVQHCLVIYSGLFCWNKHSPLDSKQQDKHASIASNSLFSEKIFWGERSV